MRHLLLTVSLIPSLCSASRLAVAAAILLTALPCPAKTFLVNTAGTANDSHPGDGAADTSDGTSGNQTTLTAAIQEANAWAGTDTITFSNVTSFTSVETLSTSIILDGTGAGRVEINNVLIISGGNCTVKGLAVSSIFISGPGGNTIEDNNVGSINISGSGGNTIEDNYIGTNLAGTAVSGAGTVFISNSPNNTIGGTTGNVIARGVSITLPASTGNIIRGNKIGTNADGTANLATTGEGVLIDNCANNIIGPDNLISGNHSYGVWVRGSGATGTKIHKNKIGTNADGTASLAAFDSGIFIDNCANTTIGPDNLISGSHRYGVLVSGSGATGTKIQKNQIGTNAAGTAALGATVAGVSVAGSGVLIEENVISGNSGGMLSNFTVGLSLLASNSVVRANLIGTDVTGDAAVPNGSTGLEIQGENNIIGGSSAGDGNVISGNAGGGLFVGGNGHQVLGNFIGVTASGAPLGNGVSKGLTGVGVNGSNHTIGGTTAAARNVIAYNGYEGVNLPGGSNVNVLLGNSIHHNARHGVFINRGDKQAAPVISANANGSLMGQLTSKPSTSFRIEFFLTAVTSADAFPQGETFLSATTVTTDASGVANFPVPGAPGGKLLTATATELVGGTPWNTSMFSNAIKAAVVAPVATSIFVVNSTGDAGDASPGDGVCDTGQVTPTGEPERTLRAAIEESNARKGKQTINFAIPGTGPFTISPATSLPAISEAVTMNGTTQPGYAGTPLVVVDGTNAPGRGLLITGGSTVVKGLKIANFSEEGIRLIQGKKNFIHANHFTGNRRGLLLDSASNAIGGSKPGLGNTFEGNREYGVIIISALAKNNLVAGNTIAGATGNVTLPSVGILIEDATANIIGGSVAEARNVVSGCADGIRLTGPGTMRNLVQGNYIGTDATGEIARPNDYGVVIADNASRNFIGAVKSGSRNVISGNHEVGVYFGDASDNKVYNNFIGLNAAGDVALPNKTGVHILGGGGNWIGGPKVVFVKNGPQVLAGNVISGNLREGILISENTPDLPKEENIVQGNYIGLGGDGSLAVPNFNGLLLEGTDGNIIGGLRKGEGNIISGNTNAAILLLGSNENTLQGNTIGVDVFGIPAPNLGGGISLSNGSSSNLIGGTVKGSANTIAHNGAEGLETGGIVIYGDERSPILNSILQNSIHSNTGLGIDLLGGAIGVLPNDTGDGDMGANQLQNYPEIETAQRVKTLTLVAGWLNSTPDTNFRLEFFANDAADPSGAGEGKTFLGFNNVKTDEIGVAEFVIGLKKTFSFVTATATAITFGVDPKGKKVTFPRSTSEFSPAVAVTEVVPAAQLASAVPGEEGRVAELIDADGNRATASLKGAGLLSMSGGDTPHLTVVGTDARSRLLIQLEDSGTGDGRVALDGITIPGGALSIIAPGVDLVGAGLRAKGHIGVIVLGDVAGGANISTGGTPAQRTNVQLRSVGDDSTLSFGSGLRTFTAGSLAQSSIFAPSLGTLRVRGDSGASIHLTGEGVTSSAPALGWLLIDGEMNGATVSVAGDIGHVRAGSLIDTTIAAGFTFGTTGDKSSGSFDADFQVDSIQVRGTVAPAFLNTSIGAARIGRVTISSAEIDNSGQSFGIVGDAEAIQIASPPFHWTPESTVDEVGDFRVNRR